MPIGVYLRTKEHKLSIKRAAQKRGGRPRLLIVKRNCKYCKKTPTYLKSWSKIKQIGGELI